MTTTTKNGSSTTIAKAGKGFIIHTKPSGRSHRATQLVFRQGKALVKLNGREVSTLKHILSI